jgi:hypothetical protein
LIPTSAIHLPGTPGKIVTAAFDQFLVYADAVLSFVAFFVAASVQQSPPLYFHSPYISEIGTKAKDTSDVDDQKGNVSRFAESSVFGLLLFTWAGDVVKIGYSKAQLAAADLPHLVSSFRASNLYNRVRASMAANPSHDPADRASLGRAPNIMNRLLWRLLVINKVAFIVQTVLALITALLYYAPGQSNILQPFRSPLTSLPQLSFYKSWLHFWRCREPGTAICHTVMHTVLGSCSPLWPTPLSAGNSGS